MTTVGMYAGIPETDYHADRETLSQSGAKQILQSPAHYRWWVEHPEYKDAFDFGTAAHKLVLGVGAELAVHEYDPDKVKSPKATKAWKEQETEVRARGGVLLLPDEHAHVRAMADKLSEHRMAMQLLSEGQPEVSAYAQDRDTGVRIRGRFDWLGPRILSDYKTSTTADPGAFVRKALDYGYDMQSAWYLDLAAACGHPSGAFAHIVQEKEAPYVVTVVILPAELIERGRNRKRRALERFRDCTEANLWPGYIPDDEFATPPAPAWALREDAA